MIKINTKKYDNYRGLYTYDDIAKGINKEFNNRYNKSNISQAFTGKNKSFKLHTLICNFLNIDIREVYKIEN